MPLDFDITPTVRQSSGLPFDQLRIIQQFVDLPLARIRRGLIYFFAGWGPLSSHYFALTTRALAAMDTSRLEIYVVDIDSVPGEFLRTTFGHYHPAGSGETAWVRDGRIVSVSDGLGAEVESEFVSRTQQLLGDETR